MEGHRHGLRWAAAVVLVTLVAGTYGVRLNDEMDQAAALHNLADGSLKIRENPPHLYEFPSAIQAPTRYPGEIPIGSTLLDYAAIPVLWAVRAADAMMPLGAWLAAAAVALCWSFVPAHRRTRAAGLLAVAAFPVAAAGFRQAGPALPRMEAVVALQLTNVLLAGACAYFVARAVRRYVPGPAAGLFVAAILLGQLTYWGGRLKYTMLAATLVAAAVWLAGEAPSVRRNLALGLVTAFAVWNNIGEGVVLAAAVGILVLVEAIRSRSRPQGGRLVAAAAIGLAVGLLPWAVENAVLRGNPFAAPYLVQLGNTTYESEGPVWLKLLGQAFAADLWRGPVDFLLNVVGAWTTGWRTQGNPVGVLAMSPLLAFAALSMRTKAAWRAPDVLAAFAVVAVHLAMLTNRVVDQGDGHDVRLLAPILPAVGLLAAFALKDRFARLEAADVERAALAAAASVLLFVLLAVAATAADLLPWGLKIWSTNRRLLLGWLAVGAVLSLAAWLLVRLRLLPWRSRAPAMLAAGVALSMPVLWTVAISFSFATHMQSDQPPERVGPFVPLVGELRGQASTVLAPSPLPTITVNNVIVFHPDYGRCDVDPSPCPWWDEQASAAVA